MINPVPHLEFPRREAFAVLFLGSILPFVGLSAQETPLPTSAAQAIPAPKVATATDSVTGSAPSAPTNTSEREFYMATNGNDSNNGSKERPFATLERARDAVRQLKKESGLPSDGVTVWVRGGTYPLAKTFSLGSEDSGAPGSPVAYRAFPGEKVTITGGRSITGFTPWKGEILKADVASQGLKGIPFHQLFFQDKRQPLARYPNADTNDPIAGGWAYVGGEPVPMYKNLPEDSKRVLRPKPEDLRRWTNAAGAQIFIFPRYNWWNDIVSIDSVDTTNGAITLGKDCSYAIRPNDRYFVQNVLEELDAPGEWYLDRADSALYFWPPSPMGGDGVTVPVLQSILLLGPGTTDVTIRGLSLAHCSETAVVLDNTTNCLVAGCSILNVGDFGGSGVSVKGGSSNGVVGNDISETGRHGIAISGGDKAALVEAGNYADNNHIHHTGVYFKQGVGIDLTGCGNRATHNLIHHEPRFAIQAFGTKHLIEYNHLHDASLETEDTGAVYTSGRDWIGGRGIVIRYNFIHDVPGFSQLNANSNSATPREWKKGANSGGIYLDDNSGGIDVIGNVVARCPRSCLQLHDARDTVVQDNIFIEGGEYGVDYGGWTTNFGFWKDFYPGMVTNWQAVKDLPAWQGMRNISNSPDDVIQTNGMVMTCNQFFRNIIVEKGPPCALYRRNKVPLDKNPTDFNLVWQGGAQASVLLTPKLPGASSNVLPWDAWVALGQDVHSKVADPLFVDASKDDYRLKPDSPARELGFQESPLDRIGPYRDELRATWPILE